jgi:hypothetical protein
VSPHLRDTWSTVDKSLSSSQRIRFNALISASLESADALTPADFALDVCQAVAVSRNLHSTADPGSYVHQLPIRAWWFSDGLYIVRTHPKFKYLLGAQIEQVGSYSPEKAAIRVAPFISGVDAVAHVRSAWFLSSPEVLHRIGATPSSDHVTLKLRLRDGTQKALRLGIEETQDPAEPLFEPMSPGDSKQPGRWDRVLDGVVDIPLTYWPAKNLSWRWIGSQSNILYIRSTSIWGENDRYGMLTELFNLVTNEVVSRKPKYVVVDLRFNTGGDFFNTVMFSEALPKLIPPDGRIFVLVGPNTISAALVTAALLKGYGRDKVALVGDVLSDNTSFWSESTGPLELPNSKIQVTTATKHLDWANGCSNLDLCSWGNVAFGQPSVSLKPEIRIVPKFSDYANGRDPVLEEVLSIAQ